MPPPDDSVVVAAILCEPAASFITGQSIPLNGDRSPT